jgi:channel protein (hemolysin III family)
MPWRSAIASMFAWHNETVNVWTHGIGGVTFVALFVFVLLGGLNHAPLPGIDGAILHEAETISSAIRSTVTADVERWTGASPAALHMDDGRAVTAQEAEEDLWYADPAHKQEAASRQYRPHASEVAEWPILVFLGSAVMLLFASATYHLMYVVGQDWFVVLSRLDYASIALLIYGSTVPALYYGFYCEPNWLYVYSFFSALTCGACLVLGLSPKFRTNDWRLVRMSAFIACGLFGVVPFSHMFVVSDQQHLEALYGLLLMGFLYISGALMYGFRIPERYFPGRFDLVFASHQIFHMCVNAACIVHYLTVVTHYRWRLDHAVCEET